MGKRIKVVTKCGEVSFHDFDQDVDTVEILKAREWKTYEETCEMGNFVKMLQNFVDEGNEDWVMGLQKTKGDHYEFYTAGSNLSNHLDEYLGVEE